MSCTQIWPPRYSLNTEHQRVFLLQSLYWSILLCLVAELCPAPCNPMDCSAPGSSIHGISQQEYWSVLPFPSPGDLPDPGIKPASPALAGGFYTAEPLGEPILLLVTHYLHPSSRALFKMPPCQRDIL